MVMVDVDRYVRQTQEREINHVHESTTQKSMSWVWMVELVKVRKVVRGDGIIWERVKRRLLYKYAKRNACRNCIQRDTIGMAWAEVSVTSCTCPIC